LIDDIYERAWRERQNAAVMKAAGMKTKMGGEIELPDPDELVAKFDQRLNAAHGYDRGRDRVLRMVSEI
jgi:uncharacterized protein YdeI (YjbR/CyaY-like superfamily)